MKILFVCTGNICRSPMAEAILSHKLQESGTTKVEVDSAGLIGYHQGESTDSRAVATLAAHGIIHTGTAREITDSDFYNSGMIVGMTKDHCDQLMARRPKDASAEIKCISEWLNGQEVEDPYYTGGFEKVYAQLSAAANAMKTELIL